MTRKEAREFVMQTLFQIDALKDWKPDIDEYIKGRDLKEADFAEQKSYVYSLLQKVCQNIESIDASINKHSISWSTDRMGKTDLAILRLATGEILFLSDIPKAVAINEAVNLAKIYGTDNSSAFINAVLKNIEG